MYSNDLPKVGFVTELLIITHFLKPIMIFGTLQRLTTFTNPLGEFSSNFGMQSIQHMKRWIHFKTIKFNFFWNSEFIKMKYYLWLDVQIQVKGVNICQLNIFNRYARPCFRKLFLFQCKYLRGTPGPVTIYGVNDMETPSKQFVLCKNTW